MNARTLADIFQTTQNGDLWIKHDAPNDAIVLAMVCSTAQGCGWNFAYTAVRDALEYLADTAPDKIDAEYIREVAELFIRRGQHDAYVKAMFAVANNWPNEMTS